MRSNSDPPLPVFTERAAQDFWLKNLSEADAFTQWVLDEIGPWLGARVLEVGCGTGTYTAAIADGHRQVVAVDMEEAYVEATLRRVGSRSGVSVICGDATQVDVPMPVDQTFDSVIMFDVLEHIEHDVDMLMRLRSRLGQGGHLILKVPAGLWLYSPMDKAIGHWRRYDKVGLCNVIRRAGYEVVAAWPFNAFAAPGWWWNGRVRKRLTPPADQVALFNRLVPVLRPLDRLARHVCGVSLFAIARRPDGS